MTNFCSYASSGSYSYFESISLEYFIQRWWPSLGRDLPVTIPPNKPKEKNKIRIYCFGAGFFCEIFCTFPLKTRRSIRLLTTQILFWGLFFMLYKKTTKHTVSVGPWLPWWLHPKISQNSWYCKFQVHYKALINLDYREQMIRHIPTYYTITYMGHRI